MLTFDSEPSEFLMGNSVTSNVRSRSLKWFSQRTVFLGRQAQITTGLWENDQPAAGGPFKNWAFYDPYSQRVYMIDVAVHAPEQDKQPFLRRMEIIASTFRTIFDTKEEE